MTNLNKLGMLSPEKFMRWLECDRLKITNGKAQSRSAMIEWLSSEYNGEIWDCMRSMGRFKFEIGDIVTFGKYGFPTLIKKRRYYENDLNRPVYDVIQLTTVDYAGTVCIGAKMINIPEDMLFMMKLGKEAFDE